MPSAPGSNSAASRVAARRRASGRDEGLDEAVDVENGRGAGSAHERECEVKLFGDGIWSRGLSVARVLRCSSLNGNSALVRKSFTDLV